MQPYSVPWCGLSTGMLIAYYDGNSGDREQVALCAVQPQSSLASMLCGADP